MDLNRKHIIQIVGFSPDIDLLTFLVKRTDLVKTSESKPVYAFLYYPTRQTAEDDPKTDIQWIADQDEKSLFTKGQFFELQHPITSLTIEDVQGYFNEIGKRYLENPQVAEIRQKILHGQIIDTPTFESFTTKLITLVQELSQEVVEKNSQRKEHVR